MSFTTDVANWTAKVNRNGIRVMYAMSEAIYAGVVLRSPIKTARFRDSHRIGLNKVATTVEPARTIRSPLAIGHPLTSQDVAFFKLSVAGLRWADEVFVSNNLDYAVFLENGGSRQNVDSIYKATADDVQASADRIIRGALIAP